MKKYEILKTFFDTFFIKIENLSILKFDIIYFYFILKNLFFRILLIENKFKFY